VLKVAAYGT